METHRNMYSEGDFSREGLEPIVAPDRAEGVEALI